MTTPTVTKRIGEYDRETHDFPAFVIFEDGQEEYIGSRPTQHDASLLASSYIIQYYTDNHTPERAAQLIHEELAQEGRHEQAAVDMGVAWANKEQNEYHAALAADEAWSRELKRLFGRNAGDVRYTEQGRSGPTLAPLYAEYRRTCDAWHAKQETMRIVPDYSGSVFPAGSNCGGEYPRH